MKSLRVLLAIGAIGLWSQSLFAHGGEVSRVALEPEVISKSAGPSQYKFQLLDTSTNKLISDQDLNVAHEKRLHMLIYDPSLKEFQHVHPEFDGVTWTVDVQFAVDGNYWVWAQGVLAVDGEEFSASNRLEITDGAVAWPTPSSLGDQRSGTSGISAIELGKNKIVAGKMVMLDLIMSRTDGTIPKLEPYLGAFAHIVATPADADSLIHVHPQETGPNQGMLHATFPSAGEYRLWVQFIDGGSLKTIPLSVKVY